MFTQATEPNINSKARFRKYPDFCHKSYHFISKCFRNQCEDEERKRNSDSRSETLVKCFDHYFEAYHNELRPNEQP